ncbi:FMN-binding protein [Clostridium sp. 'deep sea']|uniref:FMN-binding protein n=1 Tax=Clostridium sp. 'deep sea' TaxID=2779445 RepID=UPI0018966BF3|nr:FMN-binding protein [Clostridium sp. 'deep sea']QOR35218.1 FMN-binding protein [Clostridium sp. 'deep sea']
MKKKITIAVIITAIVSSFVVLVIIATILRPTPLNIEKINFELVADGKYIGICQNKILVAVVCIEVYENEVVKIEILKHKPSYMHYASQIADAVVKKQSLEVDVIAGATLTCDTVKKAIENALLKGF